MTSKRRKRRKKIKRKGISRIGSLRKERIRHLSKVNNLSLRSKKGPRLLKFLKPSK